MNRRALRRLARELERFLEYCFEGMGRRERREALSHYLRGLLLDGERKAMRPIAARLSDNPERIESLRQKMQEAVTVATWDEWELYRRLALHAEHKLLGIDAWVIDDTGFPKKGRHSVGVQRQYSGTLGRIDNCQVATSLHLASEHGGICIGMQLYLPKPWANDAAKRRKAKIPESIEFLEKWRIGLQHIERALSWELCPKPIVADAEFGNNSQFRKRLCELDLDFVLNVGTALVVWPPGTEFEVPAKTTRMGRKKTREVPIGEVEPMTIVGLGKTLPAGCWRWVTWREGTRGPQRSRFAKVRVRTAHGHSKGESPGEEMWLLCEWPERAKHPTTFWLSNLPKKTSTKQLIYLAKLRWRIERDYQEMKGELGLDHYEGRGWIGFQHHCACVAAAHAFLTLTRAFSPPRRETANDPAVPPNPSASAAGHARSLPDVPAARVQ